MLNIYRDFFLFNIYLIFGNKFMKRVLVKMKEVLLFIHNKYNWFLIFLFLNIKNMIMNYLIKICFIIFLLITSIFLFNNKGYNIFLIYKYILI